MVYLPKYFSNKAIVLYVILIFAAQIIFWGKGLEILPIIFGFLQVFGFFYFTSMLSGKWNNLSPAVFKQKIIIYGLLIRLTFVFASYYFYLHMTGDPFEYAAADSIGYHEAGIFLSNMLINGNLSGYLFSLNNVSDLGYPVFLSFIYTVFGDVIIVPRIINAILSTYTSIFIYKIAQRNFGEPAGRLAGIMAMLLPNFIYYSGLHLKETEMVFLTMAFAERADYVIRQRTIKVKNIIITLLLAFSLFYFRTVLAVASIFSFLIAALFNRMRYKALEKRMSIIIIGLILITFFTGNSLQREIAFYWSERSSNQEIGLEARHVGNRFIQYAKTSVFLPVIVMAPFPTFVNIPNQQNFMLINGAYYVRNVYAFFVIAGIYLMIRRKGLYRQHLFILFMLGSYLIILAASTFALSERFHMPALPFLLILAAYGITQMNRQIHKYYIPYLVLMFFIILAWNWLKIASRGAF